MMSSKKLAFVGNSAQTMINFRYGVMKSLAQSGYSVYVIAPRTEAFPAAPVGCGPAGAV